MLIERGDVVIGVDSLNDAYDVRLKEWRLAQLERLPRFSFHRIDVADRGALSRVMRDSVRTEGDAVHAIVNLAARAGVRRSTEDPWIYLETNITGTLNLLELCREYGIRKFVLASTSSLYGRHNPVPFREDVDTSKVLSPYAASKKGAEVLCYTYHHLYGIDITIPRYFTVFGPAGRPDMSLFRFVQWVFEGRPVYVTGDGSQSRDFTFVDDIARGTLACVDQSGYNIVNLGSDRPHLLMEGLRLIEQMVGKQANVVLQMMHPADVMATWADISKARSLLEWQPRVSFEEGISRMVEWYVANREWARDITTD